MPFLIAGVLFVGLICLLDLVLTLGVIKRLREHTELLAEASSGPPVIATGTMVDTFVTSTVDGEPVDAGALDGETLVGFFSPTCGPCQERLPLFAAFARDMPGGRDRTLAVIIGDDDEVTAPVEALRSVARVVVEAPHGALATAFQVEAFPTLLMIAPGPAGQLVVTDNEVRLDQPLAAV
jgi:thiol-disulfide isomerase/thioredoxin